MLARGLKVRIYLILTVGFKEGLRMQALRPLKGLARQARGLKGQNVSILTVG